MKEMLNVMRDAALLREPAMEAFRDRKDAMKRGVAILLACFLVAGSLAFLLNLVNSVRPFGPAQIDAAQQQFTQSLEQMQMFGATDPASQAVFDQIVETTQVIMRAGMEIAGLDTTLPRGIAGFFSALGRWLTSTVGQLLTFLGYGVWVLLFAKLLGGNGGVDRFFGLTALFAVPNLLSIFLPIPCVGSLVAFIGWIWGVVVYVKAVQVSQRLTTGRAVAAALLPAVILTLLVVIVAFFSLLMLLATFRQ